MFCRSGRGSLKYLQQQGLGPQRDSAMVVDLDESLVPMSQSQVLKSFFVPPPHPGGAALRKDPEVRDHIGTQATDSSAQGHQELVNATRWSHLMALRAGGITSDELGRATRPISSTGDPRSDGLRLTTVHSAKISLRLFSAGLFFAGLRGSCPTYSPSCQENKGGGSDAKLRP
jgi:hypothetical protein